MFEDKDSLYIGLIIYFSLIIHGKCCRIISCVYDQGTGIGTYSEIFDKLYHYPLPLGSAAKSDFMQIRCLSKHLLVGGYGIKYDTLRLKTCICRCFLDVQ